MPNLNWISLDGGSTGVTSDIVTVTVGSTHSIRFDFLPLTHPLTNGTVVITVEGLTIDTDDIHTINSGWTQVPASVISGNGTTATFTNVNEPLNSWLAFQLNGVTVPSISGDYLVSVSLDVDGSDTEYAPSDSKTIILRVVE